MEPKEIGQLVTFSVKPTRPKKKSAAKSAKKRAARSMASLLLESATYAMCRYIEQLLAEHCRRGHYMTFSIEDDICFYVDNDRHLLREISRHDATLPWTIYTYRFYQEAPGVKPVLDRSNLGWFKLSDLDYDTLCTLALGTVPLRNGISAVGMSGSCSGTP